MVVNLPWDILSTDILVRLPVKSIARFRCVNKTWCYLLKDPEFLKRQYKHAVEVNRFSIMFHNQNDIYTFSYDPSSSTCESTSHIEYPVTSYRGIEYFGCCNGLVLLRHINKSNSHVLILWNPSSNECKELLHSATRLRVWPEVSEEYGICYDHQIGDFKVVCLAQDFASNWCKVLVYTLRSNSWRRLEDIQVHMLDNTVKIPDMGRLPVKGALQWRMLGEDRRSEIILRFDFENEVFDQLPIPDVSKHDNNQVFLCVLGGSLWFLVDNYGCSLEFWELKDNGVKKSWILSFTFDIDKFDVMDHSAPLQFLENGKILFGVHDEHASLRFVLYDPENKTVATLKTYEGISASSLPTSVYIESLISLDTGMYLGQVQLDKVYNDYDPEEEEEDSDDSEVEGDEGEEEDSDDSEVEDDEGEEEEDSDDSDEEEDEEEYVNDDGGIGAAAGGTSNYDGNEEEDTLRRMKKNRTI